jgi:hypothetical protein
MPRLALLAVGVTGGVTGVLGALPFCVFVGVPPVVLPVVLPDPLVLPDPVVLVEPVVPPEPEVVDVEVVDPALEAAGVPDEPEPDPPQALNVNVKATAAAAARK